MKLLRNRFAFITVFSLVAGVISVSPARSVAGSIEDNLPNTVYGVSTTSNAAGTNRGICYITGNTVVMRSDGALLISGAGDAADKDDVARFTITGAATFTGYAENALNGPATVTNSGKVITWTSVDADDTDYFLDAVHVKPTAAGTFFVAVKYNDEGTAAVDTTVETFTVTAVAACDDGGYYEPSSSVIAVASAGGSAALAAQTAEAAGATTIAYDGYAYIKLFLKDKYGQASDDDLTEISVSSGGMTVSWTEADTAALGTSDYTTSGSATQVGIVNCPAAAASGTVTIKYAGDVIGTKAFKCQGDVAKVEVSLVGIAAASGADDAGSFYFAVKDANGNLISGKTLSLGTVSSQVTAITPAATSSATTVVASGVTCNTTSGSATLKVYTTNSLGLPVYSDPFEMKCASTTKYTYTASLDKASYKVGEIITMTITAKDAAGNLVADAATLGNAAGVTIGGTTALSTIADANNPTAGVWKYKWTAATVGSFVAQADLNLATSPAIQIPVTIASNSTDVSLNEVLASIVKLIASINKQIRALQKSLRR